MTNRTLLCALGGAWFGLTVAEGAALSVGTDLQVLWDDAVVDTALTTARRVLHHPQFAGEVLALDQPWEGDGSAYRSVFRDGGKWRMYYGTCTINVARPKPSAFKPSGVKICYAESTDAIHWTKPALGLRAFNGSKENNIILDQSDFPCMLDNLYVFKDANPACPAGERYKGIGLYGNVVEPGRTLPAECMQWDAGGGKKVSASLMAFVSGDGVNFRRSHCLTEKGAFDTLNVAFWDPNTKRYFCYLRGFHKVRAERNGDTFVRDIRVMTSRDFRTWTDPRALDFGGGEDVPLYTNGVQPYPRNTRLFVGLPTRYVERKAWTRNYDRLPDAAARRARMGGSGGSPRYGLAITDCVFMFSRDGFRFQRDDEAFMTPGPEGALNWVYGDCYPGVGFVTTPGFAGAAEELSIYSGRGHWSGGPTRIGRYTLRMDGFVSRQAPYAGAKVVTKPLVFTGRAMRVNFSTSARGRLFVTLRDETGRSLRSVELFGDQVDRLVDFDDDAALETFANRPVVVTFDMSDANLYSFGFLSCANFKTSL